MALGSLGSHIAQSKSPASAAHTVGQARVGQLHDTYGFNLFVDPRNFYRNSSQGHTWLYSGRDFF